MPPERRQVLRESETSNGWPRWLAKWEECAGGWPVFKALAEEVFEAIDEGTPAALRLCRDQRQPRTELKE